MSKMKGFGKRLKESVKNSPYTQKQLSEILGINQDTFSNYVKEVYYPKADTLYELCNLIDVSPEWLLTGEGAPRYRLTPKTHDESIENLTDRIEELNDYEKELIYNYRLLSERDQGRVDQFVLSLLEEKNQNEKRPKK